MLSLCLMRRLDFCFPTLYPFTLLHSSMLTYSHTTHPPSCQLDTSAHGEWTMLAPAGDTRDVEKAVVEAICGGARRRHFWHVTVQGQRERKKAVVGRRCGEERCGRAAVEKPLWRRTPWRRTRVPSARGPRRAFIDLPWLRARRELTGRSSRWVIASSGCGRCLSPVARSS